MSRERSRSPTAEKTVPATDHHSLPQPPQVQDKEASGKRSPTGPGVGDMQVSRQALNKREKQLDQRELELEERKVTLEERELALEERKMVKLEERKSIVAENMELRERNKRLGVLLSDAKLACDEEYDMEWECRCMDSEHYRVLLLELADQCEYSTRSAELQRVQQQHAAELQRVQHAAEVRLQHAQRQYHELALHQVEQQHKQVIEREQHAAALETQRQQHEVPLFKPE